MIQLIHQTFQGAANKSSLIDLHIPENWNQKMVLFIHGYKGFKDWGCWHLVERYFAEQGFGFCKYNVSHNGIGLDDPETFSDLDGFRFNNYSKELEDQQRAMDWVDMHTKRTNDFFVIGHSRGGGIALLNHALPQVKAIATWAAISDIGSRFPRGDQFDAWKESGVWTVKNGRTKQDMPHDFSQYLDYEHNQQRLDIAAAASLIRVPVIHIHGEVDTSVQLEEGKKLASWTNTELHIVSNAQHTFNASHPWKSTKMPEELLKVCKLTMNFFSQLP